MITIDDLKTAGIAEDKAEQILTDLGDFAKKLTPENVAKKAYDQVDLSILTMTNIPKNANEQTTEYLKRATSEFTGKQLTEKTVELNQKIQEAEEKLKNHKGDETLKEELRVLKEEKAKLPDMKNTWIKEYKDKAEKLEQEVEKIKRVGELREFLPKNIKKELEGEFSEFKINKVLEETMKIYTKTERDSQGNLYLIDPVKIDKVLAKEHFEKQLDSILDKGTSQGGTGSGKGNSPNPTSELKLDTGLNDNDKINKIREYLGTQKGLTTYDPKYTDEFNKLCVSNGLEKYVPKEKK